MTNLQKPKTPTFNRGDQVIVTNVGQTYTTYIDAAEALGIRYVSWDQGGHPVEGHKYIVWATVLHPNGGEELVAITNRLTGDSYIIGMRGLEAVKVELTPVQAVRKLVEDTEALQAELLAVTAERDHYKALVDRMDEVLKR